MPNTLYRLVCATRLCFCLGAIVLCIGACGAFPDKMTTESDLLSEWGEPCSKDGSQSLETWHYCAAPCPSGAGHAWCHGACSEGCVDTFSVTLSNGLIVKTVGPEGER
jgi:hypothetical protein